MLMELLLLLEVKEFGTKFLLLSQTILQQKLFRVTFVKHHVCRPDGFFEGCLLTSESSCFRP